MSCIGLENLGKKLRYYYLIYMHFKSLPDIGHCKSFSSLFLELDSLAERFTIATEVAKIPVIKIITQINAVTVTPMQTFRDCGELPPNPSRGLVSIFFARLISQLPSADSTEYFRQGKLECSE